ncbi:hypothetical protein [Actinomadura sp. HBU206391]|uniref:hypothetical protein n=1 Tax=Actinomadura sp. HBU206391 TaxID=2731692 RepID=UPI001650B1D5|nr:hypothetical protein [Actinomadura sp. HBU206391]MBC6461449.1 hypothetical protein [Actinomadura sp. HBU206391]
MADEWVETTIRELERWAERRDGRTDVGGARILLELAADGLGLRAAGELTPDGLDRLLLQEFPSMVAAGSDDVPAVLAAGHELVDFLADSGAVPADGAERLRVRLAGIEPEFAAAMAAADDLDQESAAEMLTRLMRADGVDPADEAAVRRWSDEFSALPEEEQVARISEMMFAAEDAVVGPVRLAPQEELAAQARGSGLTERIRGLAAWVAEREVTELTDDGGLTPEDAAAAIAELDAATTGAPEQGPAGTGGIAELTRLWRAAVSAAVLLVEDGRVRPGPALDAFAQGDDEAALTSWLAAFDAAVTPTVDPGDQVSVVEVVRKDLPGMLIHLYERPEPVPEDELFDLLFAHIEETYEISDVALLETTGRYAFTLAMEELVDWGVVRTDEEAGHALTPLGVWAVRELLLADGYRAPLVGDLAEAPAAEFLEGLVDHGEDTADEEIGLWLSRREPAEAAAELLAVMRDGTAGVRNLAAAVLHHAGPSAEPVVRRALEEPAARPYAALWLHAHGDDEIELNADEMMWIFTDTVAGLLESTEPQDAVAVALADAPADADLGAMVAEMWRVDHPDTAEVLELLGRHHPDKVVAKAARKSAFKARSRV